MTKNLRNQIEQVVSIATASLLTFAATANGMSEDCWRTEVPLGGVNMTKEIPLGKTDCGDMTGIAEVWSAVAIPSTAGLTSIDSWEVTNTITGVTYFIAPYSNTMEIYEKVVSGDEYELLPLR